MAEVALPIKPSLRYDTQALNPSDSTMIEISLCIILSIFHVGLSQQIPPLFKGPAPDVENPRDCCKSENIFSEEDFKECDIENPKEDEKRGQVLYCSTSKCVLNRYSLMKDVNTVDKEAVAAFLDEYFEKNADYKDAVESVKNICLKDGISGPSKVCEANKIAFCILGNIFMNCPNWKDTENCKKLKNYFEDCKKYTV